MVSISDGRILVYHLFSIAETIDLDHLRQTWRGDFSVIRLISRRAAPSYIQFTKPPLLLPLGQKPLFLTPDHQVQADVRAKIFDFGVVSLCWEIAFPAHWQEVVENSGLYIDNEVIVEQSETIFTSLKPALEGSLRSPYPDEILMEDYTIFFVRDFADPQAPHAETVLREFGADIACMIRGEQKVLSQAEQQETLRQNISYFEDDLVVVDWNASFVYDPEGSSEHIDIMEYANSQLLELRYYDALLDRELDKIYDKMSQKTGPHWRPFMRNPYDPTSKTLLTLLIDVVELTGYIENSLKIIGDLYSARVYRAIAERLRLKEWESSIDGKLDSARQIYQVLTDNLNTWHSMILEVTIVLLITFEIIWAFFSARPH